MQRQTAVAAHFSSEQLLLFAFAGSRWAGCSVRVVVVSCKGLACYACLNILNPLSASYIKYNEQVKYNYQIPLLEVKLF